MTLPDTIGWTATAVFTTSYLTRRQSTLRRVQMAGACLWLTYGLVTQAAPVIGSNVLVLGAALWAEHRYRRDRRTATPSAPRSGQGVPAEAEAA
jgi:hypothetical protein